MNQLNTATNDGRVAAMPLDLARFFGCEPVWKDWDVALKA
jgi:hypothetical protein